MKCKVLYVSPNAHLGGAEKILEILLKYHDRSQFEPSVYFLKSGPLEKTWKETGTKIFKSSQEFRFRKPIQLLKEQMLFKNVLQKEQFSLVHSTMSYGHLFAGPPSLLARVPEMWFQHGPVGKSWDFWAAQIPSRCILYNSNHTRDQQEQHKSSFGKVVYGPVEIPDLNQAGSSRQSFRSRFGFQNSDFVCVHIARIDAWKGQKEFILAIQQAREKNKSIKAVIVGNADIGSQSYQQELLDLVKSYQLTEIVHFAGFMNPVDEAYFGADLFVHTSTLAEPLGLTILEAMARKCPVLTSSLGGFREILKDQSNSLSAIPQDISDLSEKISQLSSAPNLRSKLAEQACQDVQKFEARAWVRSVEQIYLQSLGGERFFK